MRIKRLQVDNFRLLHSVALELESETTLIVGRNNSGKTSLAEVVRRFLMDSTPTFRIEDFSNASYAGFCEAHKAKVEAKNDSEIREKIPSIELRITIEYDKTLANLGALSDFIVDLNPECNDALIVANYELQDGKIDELFEGLPDEELTAEQRLNFFTTLRERIPALFATKVRAEDPNDETNRKEMSNVSLRSVLRAGFVNAQRGLDDTTTKDTDTLARILETMFNAVDASTTGGDDKEIAEAINASVQELQNTLDTDFNDKVKSLLPTFESFGYPGLDGPELATETTLDAKKLLTNHTKVKYLGSEGVYLPESYNGLGIRNLIFILLQIVSYYRSFRAGDSLPSVFLLFIEEPEAHLHPQMQEVFIRQLSKIAQTLNEQDGVDIRWPVQFVVSTHSSHIANAARFEAIRYFLPTTNMEEGGIRQTSVKDLRVGLHGEPDETRDFLHQYLTLTRCDLFFSDKAILVEGTAERICLPVIIDKLETAEPDMAKLSTQYITILEVGGAYAHLFFPLLDFLELRTLIITDLDSVGALNENNKRKACPVNEGERSSNSCVNAWFNGADTTIAELISKTDKEKVQSLRRIAYQKPDVEDGPCGRTFEDAFMLTNATKFQIDSETNAELESEALGLVGKLKKSEFALRHAISDNDWEPPLYILEGLRWLSTVGTVDDDANPEIPNE